MDSAPERCDADTDIEQRFPTVAGRSTHCSDDRRALEKKAERSNLHRRHGPIEHGRSRHYRTTGIDGTGWAYAGCGPIVRAALFSLDARSGDRLTSMERSTAAS